MRADRATWRSARRKRQAAPALQRSRWALIRQLFGDIGTRVDPVTVPRKPGVCTCAKLKPRHKSKTREAAFLAHCAANRAYFDAHPQVDWR